MSLAPGSQISKTEGKKDGWMEGRRGGGRRRRRKRVDNAVESPGCLLFLPHFFVFVCFGETPPVEFTQVGNLISPQSFLGERVIYMALHP